MEAAEDPRPTGRTQTVCTVGSLRAECEILHPVATSGPRGHDEAAPWPASGSRRSLYAGGFRQRRQLLEDVEADFSENRARARLRTTFIEEISEVREGLDATLYFAASPVDCFAAALQLGQLLLYQLDDVPRAQSHTLWMRETSAELDPGRGPLPATADVTVSLQRLQLLENSKGEVWRTADIVGELHGARVRCSVAHRIPGNPVGASE